MTFDNQDAFFSAANASITFDFETRSGFPLGTSDNPGTPIGSFNGINFDANVQIDDSATSGTQILVGNTGTFGTATINFSEIPVPVNGVGLFGLDLTVGEIIRVDVEFSSGESSVFDVSLGGAQEFTPTYFGVLDTMSTIDRLTILGTDGAGSNRAWGLDDLTVNVVPEPSTYALMISVVLALMLLGYQKTIKQ